MHSFEVLKSERNCSRSNVSTLQQFNSHCSTPVLQYSSTQVLLFRMKKRGIPDDADGDDKKSPAGAPPRTAESSETSIKENDFAEEFSSDLPSMDMPSAPSGSPAYASLPSASMVQDDDDSRDLGHGSARDTKILEHAPTGDPIPSPSLRMTDSFGRPLVVFASSHDVAPGAFPVRSSHNIATNRTFRAPTSSYGSTTADESKQEEEMPTSAEAHTNVHNSSRMAARSALYTVEAQLVANRNEEEEEKVMVAEAQYVRMKWYQRPFYRWMFLGLALFACCLVGAVVVLVVLVIRPSSAASSSSLTTPSTVPTVAPKSKKPTRAPTTTADLLVACKFLSVSNVPTCRSRLSFGLDGGNTIGSTIPSEIGLLTQLTYLNFESNDLTSTIPSEIGLLTQLTHLNFYINALTSTIPTEIGLLTQLTLLWFDSNALTSTIPSEIGLLTQLSSLGFSTNTLVGAIPSSLCSLSVVYIDCGEITCASGCCLSGGSSSCG